MNNETHHLFSKTELKVNYKRKRPITRAAYADLTIALLLYYLIMTVILAPRGGHNMLRVRVCAAHMGEFLGPKFSKQGSLFRQIFLKPGWIFRKLAKNWQ